MRASPQRVRAWPLRVAGALAGVAITASLSVSAAPPSRPSTPPATRTVKPRGYFTGERLEGLRENSWSFGVIRRIGKHHFYIVWDGEEAKVGTWLRPDELRRKDPNVGIAAKVRLSTPTLAPVPPEPPLEAPKPPSPDGNAPVGGAGTGDAPTAPATPLTPPAPESQAPSTAAQPVVPPVSPKSPDHPTPLPVLTNEYLADPSLPAFNFVGARVVMDLRQADRPPGKAAEFVPDAAAPTTRPAATSEPVMISVSSAQESDTYLMPGMSSKLMGVVRRQNARIAKEFSPPDAVLRLDLGAGAAGTKSDFPDGRTPAAMSADGRFAIAVAHDGYVEVWDISGPKAVRISHFKTPERAFAPMFLAADRIALGLAYADPQTQERLAALAVIRVPALLTPTAADSEPPSVDYLIKSDETIVAASSSNGKQLVVSSGNKPAVLITTDGVVLRNSLPTSALGFFSLDGRYFVESRQEGGIVNLETGERKEQKARNRRALSPLTDKLALCENGAMNIETGELTAIFCVGEVDMREPDVAKFAIAGRLWYPGPPDSKSLKDAWFGRAFPDVPLTALPAPEKTIKLAGKTVAVNLVNHEARKPEAAVKIVTAALEAAGAVVVKEGTPATYTMKVVETEGVHEVMYNFGLGTVPDQRPIPVKFASVTLELSDAGGKFWSFSQTSPIPARVQGQNYQFLKANPQPCSETPATLLKDFVMCAEITDDYPERLQLTYLRKL